MRVQISFSDSIFLWFSVFLLCSLFSMAGVLDLTALSDASIHSGFAQDAKSGKQNPLVAKILRYSGEYCKELDRASLDFVCIEDISERIDNSKEINAFYYEGSWQLNKQLIEKHRYVYDYQFVRLKNRRIEKRTLLEEDGARKNIIDVPDTATRMFSFRNIFFSASNLLAEYRQSYYDYRIAGDEVIDGIPAVILHASPFPSAGQNISGGKIWFKKDDFDILRIDWDSEDLEKSWVIQKTAKFVKGEPLINQSVVFGLEKNGVRFPTRFAIEENYIKKNGKKFTKSKTTVIYKDYRFFTVETEVKYMSGVGHS